MSESMSPPYKAISKLLHEGKVIPFLGAGVNFGHRQPPTERWTQSAPFLPSGCELALHLADECEFPLNNKHDREDLIKVASYYEESVGRANLREYLHDIFAPPATAIHHAPCNIHEYLAGIEKLRLVITTNYDRLAEKAFARRPYWVVVHPTDKAECCNQVLCWKYDPADPHAKIHPQAADPSYLSNLIDLDTTPVIYKMHGTVSPEQLDWDSFVISENDYLDFLSRMTQNTAIPAIFWEHFHDRHFLFLGYGLSDWNLRLVLRNVFDRKRSSRRTTWAIQYRPSTLEMKLWSKRDVDIYDVDINKFVAKLKVAESQPIT